MSRTVIITGASRGIGAACAKKFGFAGYNVVVNYNINKDRAEEVCREVESCGGRAVAIKADVSVRTEVEAMFEETLKLFGGIDVLINNAGISSQQLFDTMSYDDWKHMCGVNLDGVFNASQCALKCMISQKSGNIVNISSIWGITGASCEVAYSATKAAVIGLTKALAKEVGPSNIRVNCVAPGMIDTDMNKCHDEEAVQSFLEETPLGKMGSAKDVANAVFFLVSEESGFITGQVLSPNGGVVI